MPSKSKELDWKVRATEQFMRKKECISYSNFIYLLNDSSEYIMCVFYIAVFGMSLVWGISMNAPNKEWPRARHGTAEIPFSRLTGILLSCGHGCLLTSYCKKQMPRESRRKVRGGFLPGVEKNRRTDCDEGPDQSMVDDSLQSTFRSVLATAAFLTQLVLRASSALSPQFCPLADCSAPSSVAAPLSPPRLCDGVGPWHSPVNTLSHSLVTEQWGWRWTTGDPDMRTCNEVHCHNQELQHPGSATLSA